MCDYSRRCFAFLRPLNGLPISRYFVEERVTILIDLVSAEIDGALVKKILISLLTEILLHFILGIMCTDGSSQPPASPNATAKKGASRNERNSFFASSWSCGRYGGELTDGWKRNYPPLFCVRREWRTPVVEQLLLL